MGDDQRATVAWLADAATHGAVVERVTTHISELFLVGERVFKLKRAVRFPYLDFSTVAQRRAACAAEIAINRRTAPELYLGVAPIRRAPDGTLALGAIGEMPDPTPDPATDAVIDWVVVMRRFDQDTLFDRLAVRGTLTDALMAALADQVVALHRAAVPCRGVAGGPALRAILEESLGELAAPTVRAPADLVARVSRQSRAALDAVAALLDRRAAQGKVRHGHGDLHLRNICLIDGRPTLFDAIEFNPALAEIDVLYDLAFLVMDLLHRDRRDLANRLLNRYLESLDELDGVPALGVLMAMRAIVRAKIDADQTTGYLDLALACLAPGSPRLVALGGFSGTGKTTVARALAPALGRVPGALVLRSDVIRKQLAGVAPETRLDAAAYGRMAATQVYDEMRRRAAPLLRAGYSVVLDAVHARAAERTAAADLAHRLDVPFTGLWLRAAPKILVDRVVGRAGDASDATPAVVEQQLGYDTGVIDWPAIDTGGGFDAVLAAARGLVAAASGTGGGA